MSDGIRPIRLPAFIYSFSYISDFSRWGLHLSLNDWCPERDGLNSQLRCVPLQQALRRSRLEPKRFLGICNSTSETIFSSSFCCSITFQSPAHLLGVKTIVPAEKRFQKWSSKIINCTGKILPERCHGTSRNLLPSLLCQSTRLFGGQQEALARKKQAHALDIFSNGYLLRPLPQGLLD